MARSRVLTRAAEAARLRHPLWALVVTLVVALASLMPAPTSAGPQRATANAAAADAVAAATPAAAARSPLEFRAQLEELLGLHTFLVDRLARAQLRGDPDLAQAANSALVASTNDLRALVGSLYGSQAAAEFADAWAGHASALFAYARARATHDTAGQQSAEALMARFESQLASSVQAFTHGRASAAVLKPAIDLHMQQLVAHLDAYQRGDYRTAILAERNGYRHMFTLGAILARGIYGTATTGPAADLRSQLGLLLGEHVELAVDMTRSGVQALPDFSAQTAALDANSEAIAAAVSTLFGAAAARQFLQVWADHIDALVSYSQATLNGDSAARQRAADRMHRLAPQLGALLSAATGHRLSAGALATIFGQHDDLLMQQVDQYHAKDYAKSYATAYTAYRQMFDVAAIATGAIRATIESGAPRGGAQTGFGWAATHPARS